MTHAPSTGFRRPKIDESLIAEYLRVYEERHKRLMVGAVAGGIAICMFMVLLLTVLVFILYGGHFATDYLLVAVISMPICFAAAHYIKGSILEPSTPDMHWMEARTLDQGPGIESIVEIPNFGPRLVLYGIKSLKNQDRSYQPAPARIAAAVQLMFTTDAAIAPAKLLQPGETTEDLDPLLAFLLYHEIVDMSKTGDRMWLTTEGKRKLGLTPPAL